MKTAIIAVMSVMSVMMLSSCGKEETVKGRPVSQWIERLDDRDMETRMLAAMALRAASPEAVKPAKKRLLELANQPRVLIEGKYYDERDQVAAQWVLEEKFGIHTEPKK